MASQPARTKKILAILGVISAMALVLVLSFRLWIQPVVDQAVQLGLEQLQERGYLVDYEKLRFYPLRRRVVLQNVLVAIDTTRIRSGTCFTANLSKLEVKLEKYPLGENNRFLAIQRVYLKDPVVQLHSSGAFNQTDQPSEPLNYYSLIQPVLDSLSVESIRVENGLFKQLASQETSDTLEIKGISLLLEKLYLDSLQSSQNRGLPSIGAFTVSVDSLQQISQDSLYAFSIAKTQINVLDSTVILHDVQVQSNSEKFESKTYSDDQKSHWQTQISSIRITSIHPSHWFTSRQVVSGRISIDSAILKVRRNKGLRRSSRFQPLLASAMQSIPLQFKIDTITVWNSRIIYREKNTASVRAGAISFDNLYASLYNATNFPTSHEVFEANIRTDLMNRGRFNVSLQMPLNREDGYHRLTGKLGRMHLTEMNTFLEPVAFTSVQNGVANRLSFEIEADNHSAQGKVHFIYSGLKVSLLNQDAPQNPAIRELVGTWLANWFVVKTNNPTRRQPLRIGNIYYQRDPSRSIFSYWCHSLLSGLKESIGLSKPDETTASTQMLAKEEESRPGLIRRIFKKSQD
ncbi:MAG: hypothetical protein AAF944_08310 [Bacteroidota bacterium]